MKATDEGLVLGPVLLRIIAYAIDSAILVVLLLAIASTGAVSFNEDGRPADVPSVVIPIVFAASYHIGYLAWRSATPGKMLMNIYVAYPDGTPLRPDTAILRYLIIFINNLFLIGAIISLVLMVTDRRRRTIHDRVAGTMVLAGRAGAPLRADEQGEIQR